MDQADPPDASLRQFLHDNQVDLSVVEGLRLIVAFNRIKDSSDRQMLIELAERLGH
jgi:hypothetical protein